MKMRGARATVQKTDRMMFIVVVMFVSWVEIVREPIPACGWFGCVTSKKLRELL